MHTIELEAEGRSCRRARLQCLSAATYVVSVRRGTRQGFVNVRRRSEEEPELLRHGPAYVLYALMDAVVDRYFPVIDALTEEIELLEETIFAGQTTRANIAALYGLKRKLSQTRARQRAAS